MRALAAFLLMGCFCLGIAQDQLQVGNKDHDRVISLLDAFERAGIVVGYKNHHHRRPGPPGRFEAAVWVHASIMNAHAAAPSTLMRWREVEPGLKQLPWLLNYFARELEALEVDMPDLREKMLEVIDRMEKGKGPFRDVPASHWAADALAELRKLGIMRGYPDGNFERLRA